MSKKMMNRKRIGIDARELTRNNLGSLGFILLEVMKYLGEYDLFLYSDINVPSEYVPENAKVISRGKEYTGGLDLYRFQYWMKKKMKVDKIDVYFQINHFSVVHTRGIKQIVVVHDLYLLDGIEKHSVKQKAIYWISLLGTMLNADTIFTVSDFSKKRLEHHYWKSPKIEVNYNGIDEPLEIENLNSFACVDGPFCLMLGRVNYYKRTMRIVELFDKYLLNSGYKLVIAGQAKSQDVVEQMNAITARNDNIIWLNYVDNNTKEWLLRNCSLFIYASRYDGFGIPPLEAGIRKKKSIISDIDVLKEVTKGKGNYVDFDAGDEIVTEAIVHAIKSEDSAQIQDMYDVAKSYTWKKYADKVIDAIER